MGLFAFQKLAEVLFRFSMSEAEEKTTLETIRTKWTEPFPIPVFIVIARNMQKMGPVLKRMSHYSLSFLRVIECKR